MTAFATSLDSPAEAPARPSRTRWLSTAIKLLVLLVVVLGVRHSLVRALAELSKHSLSIDYAWLAVAGTLYLSALGMFGLFWHRLMVAFGQHPRLRDTAAAYFIGHLGKYVPGKALVVVMRAALVRGPRVDAGVAAATVFLETINMMAVGSAIAFGVLALIFPSPYLWLIALGLLVVAAGMFVLLPLARRAFRYIERKQPRWVKMFRGHRIGWGVVATGFVWSTIGWAFHGLSLWATLRAVGAQTLNPISDLPLSTAAVAVSVVAGFLSFFPAGLVAREFVLLEVLNSAGIDSGPALAVAVLQRLVSISFELAISGILYFSVVWRRRP